MNLQAGVLAGGLTLVVMILPTILRTTQESLKTVPQSYREGALGLGAGKWRMVRTVVLPNAIDGIVTGCILAVGRIVGESAALLYTAGFGLVLNDFFTALHSSSATLTVALYVYANERGETAVAFSIASAERVTLSSWLAPKAPVPTTLASAAAAAPCVPPDLAIVLAISLRRSVVTPA